MCKHEIPIIIIVGEWVRLSVSMSSLHHCFKTIIQLCLWLLLFLTFVMWKLSAVWLILGSYSSQETVSAMVLCMPLIQTILGLYSLNNNLHQYTQSEVKPRASLIRFAWSVNTVICWPHSISLNSFNVSTMASSSILVMLYLRCVAESFQLKNTIGLFSWVITAPSCLLEASVSIL